MQLTGLVSGETRERTAEMDAGSAAELGLLKFAGTIAGADLGDIGEDSDAAVTNPALNATVIAALKGLLTLLGATLVVDATGQGDVPVTLDSEVVEVDATGQGDVPVTMDGEEVVISEPWTVGLQASETTNDSDITFTVPASTEWQIMSIWIELAATATAGNRQVVVELQDSSSDVIGQFRAGAVQAESTTYYYMFAPAVADLDEARDSDYLSCPLSPMIVLPAGYKVRVYDNNAVDAAADDMVIQMMVAARSTA